jgi:hypothetical protein
MGPRFIDMVGQRFERLVVVEHLGRHHHGSLWLCRCDCGNETRTVRSSLVNGTAKSCGCYRSDRMSTLTYKHGERGGEKRQKVSPEYKAWDSIKQRCFNPADKAWEWYGGRGITMCPEWREDFAAFLAHIGERPTARHSIDRINGDRGYEPGNVRWANWNEQANNRKNNRIVIWNGRQMTMKQAADAAGMPYKSVKGRVQTGWDVIKALTTPLNMNKVNAKRNPRQAKRAS